MSTLHFALVQTLLFLCIIARVCCLSGSESSVRIDVGTWVEKLSDLSKISSQLADFGLSREDECYKANGLVSVFLDRSQVHLNLGLHHLQVHGVLELRFQAGEVACFRALNELEPGSLLTIPIGDAHSVHIRVADIWWLKRYYANVSSDPPCVAHDMDCVDAWHKNWQELNDGVAWKHVPRLVNGILYGNGTLYSDGPQAAAQWDPSHVDQHLRRMNALISALGKPSLMANLLEEIAKLNTKHFKRWLEVAEDQQYCDMLDLKVAETDDWWIAFHAFKTYVPHCNGFRVHDHNKFFATKLLQGRLSENLFVPIGSAQRGWPDKTANESESDNFDAWVRAARIERDELAYQTHGCDAGPGPLEVGDGRRLHGLTAVGSRQPDPVVRFAVEHVACEQRLPGEHLVYPLSWMHRPRLANGSTIAFTVTLNDKTFGAEHIQATFVGGVPGNPQYSAKLMPKRTRPLLRAIVDRLRRPVKAAVPRVGSALADGGIPKYVDSILGRTYDDTIFSPDKGDEEDGNDMESRDAAEL